MPERSLTKIEKIHIVVQTLTQATTFIAAVVVAWWGYYSTVYVKKEKEVTEYTLKDLRQKTAQQPHIQVKVKPTVLPLADGERLIQIGVTLSNLGNIQSKVTLDDNSLTLVPVVFDHGRPTYRKPINLLPGRYAGTFNRAPLGFVNVGAGESYELTFVHKLESPGTYLIHFLALNGIDPPAEDFLVKSGVSYNYAVGADHYLVLE